MPSIVQKKISFVFFIFLFLLNSCTPNNPKQDCLVTRAAFDIGSGASKMRVLEVNKCTHKIIKKVEGKFCDYNEKVAYKEDLKQNGKISLDVIKKGQRVLKAMKIHALKCGAIEFAGSATSAFRQASNGREAVKELSRTGIKVKIISQQEEANLGYLGAIAKSGANQERTCVWDIGGSSMQIICPNNLSYLGHLASVPFKHQVIQIQKSLKSSPNPISSSDYKKVSDFTKTESSIIKNNFKLIDLKKMNFVGIGGVHYYAIAKAIGKNTLSISELEDEVQKRLNKSDEDLGSGKYVDTYVSNLILVKSIMGHLGIKTITIVNVNLTEGLSLSESYWN